MTNNNYETLVKQYLVLNRILNDTMHSLVPLIGTSTPDTDPALNYFQEIGRQKGIVNGFLSNIALMKSLEIEASPESIPNLPVLESETKIPLPYRSKSYKPKAKAIFKDRPKPSPFKSYVFEALMKNPSGITRLKILDIVKQNMTASGIWEDRFDEQVAPYRLRYQSLVDAIYLGLRRKNLIHEGKAGFWKLTLEGQRNLQQYFASR